MRLTVLIDDGANPHALVANLNDDVSVSFGGGEFSITASYPTYDIDEIQRRTDAGESVVPVTYLKPA